jgi:PEP-CTERM motif
LAAPTASLSIFAAIHIGGYSMKTLLLKGAAAAALLSFAASAHAGGIIDIDESAFQAGAGQITFSEVPLGTVNPTYNPSDYGGGAGSPIVTFGGFFLGQSLGAASPPCPAGAALSGCVLGNPTGPLALDPSSPQTFTTNDGSNPDSPVLSGSPTFNGPIAIEFSTPQTGVGLIGGYFNSVASTAITAFDVNGNVIGSVSNTQIGLEFLGLVTADHSATISGLLFSLVGDEPAGFAIDDVRFGVGSQVVVPGVPEPSTWAMMLIGFAGIGFAAYRRAIPRAA